MTSFLICKHNDHTDLYRNGLPLGVIRNEQFELHHHTMPDGSKVPIDQKLVEETIGELYRDGLGLRNYCQNFRRGLHK
jgi:hypothetical protein